jgi:TolB protein
MPRLRPSPLVLLAVVLGSALALWTTPANATFPGSNGRIAFADYVSGQIYAVNPDGTGLRQLTHTGPNRANDFPSWSPNGKRILFARSRTDLQSTDNSRIWIMNADGSGQRRLAEDVGGFRDYSPRYTPDAQRIVFTRCQPADGVCAIWKMHAGGTHKRPITRFQPGPRNEAVDFSPAVSPNGKRIAFTRFFSGGLTARVLIAGIDGRNPHAITPSRLEGAAPDWAPSGRRIAFNSHGPRNGSSLFKIKPDGSGLHRLTSDRFPNNDGLPTYAPRGNRVAFISDRNYPDICCIDLFAIDADGGDEHMVDIGLSDPGVLRPSWGSAPLVP